jgi:phage tail-like protein
MPTRIDPYSNSHFLVEIDGVPDIGFVEAVLPQASAEVIDYRTGADTSASRKLPGLAHYSNLVLRRGVTPSTDLFDWWKNIANGVADRRSVSVSLLDGERNIVKRWVVRNAWPCRYFVAPLISIEESCGLIETIELAAEGFELVS